MLDQYDPFNRMIELMKARIPAPPPDPIPWMEENVEFPNSVRSKRFNVSITPWIREPLLKALDLPTRIVTFMKPIQSGGSTLGEAVMLYWIMFWHGFLQYNWSNDKRAKERWESRIENILKACGPVKDKLDHLSLYDATKLEVDFGNVFFRMQGVFVPDNLDSDSIPMQINEEVHAWEPGHLKKAAGRSTAVWNFKRLDISNAGDKGDQLDLAFRAGTMQYWSVKCPGCSNPHHEANSVYHVMRTKFDKKRPDLGGLCYDADGCRLDHGEYNYAKLVPTIYYQMPCGYKVHDDIVERKALSDSGRYTPPTHVGALGNHVSYTYDAVTVDYISWLQLIQEKHDAIRARRLGDMEPWKRYMRERECIPFNLNDVPTSGVVVINEGVKKNRDGLPGKKLRLFELDRQQGEASKGEFPYWWLLIRDWQMDGQDLRSRLVYEGRLNTDEEVIGILNEHGCQMWQGVADSGDDTTHVYLFCMKYGINAIKGDKAQFFVHQDGARRIFSPERPLHSMLNRPPKYPYIDTEDGPMPDPREPLFWLYSKSGIRERFHWIRTQTKFETPEDVSDDYKNHMESEEREVYRHPTTNEEMVRYIQLKDRNDLYVCECYGAMQVDQSGMIGIKSILSVTTENKTK